MECPQDGFGVFLTDAVNPQLFVPQQVDFRPQFFIPNLRSWYIGIRQQSAVPAVDGWSSVS